MTWSYDESNIGLSTAAGRLNAVRTLIQDTDTDAQQLQDEEIAFHLSQVNDDVYAASAVASETLAARYARYGDTSIDNGGVSVNYKDVTEGYRLLATQMRKLSKQYGTTGIGMPAAGGLTKSGVRAADQLTDRLDPAFKGSQFRNRPVYGDDDSDDRIR